MISLMDDEEFDEVMKSSGVVYSPFLEYAEGMKQNAYDGHFQ